MLVDTGWATTRGQLVEALQHLGATARDIRQVVITHVHADHCGLAGWFQEHGAEVVMHQHDADDFAIRYFDETGFLQVTRSWASAVGLPEDDERVAFRQAVESPQKVTRFRADRRVRDSDSVVLGPRHLKVLHTPGHTAGHCCYYEPQRRLLFSGDHLFPRMRTNPTSRQHSSDDPVGDYLASLDRLERLDVDLVLPGHQSPFEGVKERVEEVRAYHRARLDEVLAVVRQQSLTAYAVSARLTRKSTFSRISPPGRLTAVGETLAHLRHLELQGSTQRDGDDPILWSAV